ncbi:uncharacterized protein G2W53_041265 [Senna tora]|uniref:Uncharacterized protein n=1 Tax=Senna tora TaxID=362788 RepID=A0A834SRN5_9FABA|nr:uncharacterized protein G2W53_041265 [Senna tora]
MPRRDRGLHISNFMGSTRRHGSRDLVQTCAELAMVAVVALAYCQGTSASYFPFPFHSFSPLLSSSKISSAIIRSLSVIFNNVKVNFSVLVELEEYFHNKSLWDERIMEGKEDSMFSEYFAASEVDQMARKLPHRNESFVKANLDGYPWGEIRNALHFRRGWEVSFTNKKSKTERAKNWIYFVA